MDQPAPTDVSETDTGVAPIPAEDPQSEPAESEDIVGAEGVKDADDAPARPGVLGGGEGTPKPNEDEADQNARVTGGEGERERVEKAEAQGAEAAGADETTPSEDTQATEVAADDEGGEGDASAAVTSGAPADEVTEATEAPDPQAENVADPDADGAEGVATDEPETEAATEETVEVAEPDPTEIAAQECLAIAGAADAGVPSAAVDAASQRETLARAAEACTMAAESEAADPEVLFHAAAIAQARGQADETYALLTRSAEAGLGAAETRLGDYFLFGVGPQGQDIAQAVTHYQSATDLDDAAGMTTLALLYQVARGVPRDPARMVELMTRAADKGYHFAQYRLAQTYLNGDGIPGRADAALGIPDVTKAVDYYTRAADAGNLSAALELSSLYADPSSGVPENPAEQVRLTRMVSQSGHPPAVAMMGVFYETGRGVDYDPKIAAGLYVRAMESGKVEFGDLRNGAPGAWDRDTALEFQTILKERGLYDGALDAIIGGGTAAAARKLADG
ncbi:MAG: hypothetical protein VX874_10700 [Pseudomonadota bacterium]|nr:hypothetical protein [Pseudomonadota bacterium]